MNGLILIGNSVIKAATSSSGVLTEVIKIYYRNSDNLAALLTQELQAFPLIKNLYLASVAKPEVTNTVAAWFRNRGVINITPLVSQSNYAGLINGYSHPERLGVDRWLNMIAVYNLNKFPAIIVDAGTALTIDVVTADGQHRGGYIMSGLSTLRRELIKTTNIQLIDKPAISIKQLATDTENAVHRGTLYCIVNWINAVVADTEAGFNCNFSRVITGGDAQQLEFLLLPLFTPIDNLSLTGMVALAQGGV